MSSLGFVNQISNQPVATEYCLESIRKFYPDAPVVFSVDGSENYHHYSDSVTEVFYKNVEWVFNKETLGYPPYKKDKVLEWLKRLYISVLKLGTTHFMLVEDDLLFLNPIKLDPDWECVGHIITHGNKIPEHLLYSMQSFSGNNITTDYYGNGGGSIFKTKTFIENYVMITEYINAKWWMFEEDYWPQCGYMDCFLSLYFLLCGKVYTPNTRMLNLDPHSEEGNLASKNASDLELTEKYEQDYDLIHNFKFHYQIGD